MRCQGRLNRLGAEEKKHQGLAWHAEGQQLSAELFASRVETGVIPRHIASFSVPFQWGLVLRIQDAWGHLLFDAQQPIAADPKR